MISAKVTIFLMQKKKEADTLPRVSIWALKRQGFLSGREHGNFLWRSPYTGNTQSFSLEAMLGKYDGVINFKYTYHDRNGQCEDFDFGIILVTTACNYGGRRFWFQCPFLDRERGKR